MSLHRRVAAPVMALSLVAAGCGGGPAQPTPRAWAKSVCSALATWRARIDDLSTKAQRQMSGADTPATTRQGLVELLDGAQSASEAGRVKVLEAGIPEVEGGERIVSRFTDSLRTARDAYRNAKDTVQALDTTDAMAFNRSVAAAFAKLNQEYAQSALDTRNVDSIDLQRAFAEVAECR